MVQTTFQEILDSEFEIQKFDGKYIFKTLQTSDPTQS